MSQNSKRILCVDDEYNALELIEKLLRDAGYTADTAVTGEDALIKLKTNEYNLIISDLMMPVYDGMKLLKKVRENSNIPFIFVSAGGRNYHSFMNNSEKVRYVCKPYSIQELLDIVHQMI